MASETKVGLLVGLGFIVCFAVILANRGREDQISAQLPYSLLVPPPDGNSPADRTPTAPAHADRRAERTSTGPAHANRLAELQAPASRFTPVRNRQTDASHLADASNRPADTSRFADASHRQAPSPPDTGVATDSDMVGQSIAGLRRSNDVASRLPGERVANGQRRTSGAALRGHRDQRPNQPNPQRSVLGDSANPTGGAGDRRAYRPPTVDRPRSPASARTDTRRLQALVDRTVPSPPRKTSKKRTTPVRAASGQKYTVVSGDNLYRIARKHYGTGSRELVRAIFEANRTVLTNENEVQIGDELLLPDVNGKPASPGSARVSKTKPQHEKHDSSAKPIRRRGGTRPFRWYQVAPHDRYSTIAASQLGDSRRWKELFELNRDIFPDPDRIRTGVKIRIPTVKVADARGGRP